MFKKIYNKSVNIIKNKVKKNYDLIPRPARKSGVLFIHIPKAAGTSVSMELYNFQIGHRKAKDYINSSADSYEKIDTFTVVREPADRFLSAYRFIMADGMTIHDRNLKAKYFSDVSNVDEFALKVYENRHLMKEIIHLIPQVEYVFYNGTCVVDYIYKLEELEIEKVNSDLGLNLSFNRLNKTADSEVAELSNTSLEYIKELYSDDYYKFNY